MLTLEDAHRFRKGRDVGCYLALPPGRKNSGQSEPQMHISKEGDPYLRTLLVQGAHDILGPFGADSVFYCRQMSEMEIFHQPPWARQFPMLPQQFNQAPLAQILLRARSRLR